MKDMIFGAPEWLIICILLTFNFIGVLHWHTRTHISEVRSWDILEHTQKWKIGNIPCHIAPKYRKNRLIIWDIYSTTCRAQITKIFDDNDHRVYIDSPAHFHWDIFTGSLWKVTYTTYYDSSIVQNFCKKNNGSKKPQTSGPSMKSITASIWTEICKTDLDHQRTEYSRRKFWKILPFPGERNLKPESGIKGP